jgi:hypothetical protein
MTRRAFTSLAAATLVIATLAGCAASSSTGFDSAAAKAQATKWIASVSVAARGTKASPGVAALLPCELDTGFIRTSSDWRILGKITVPNGTTKAAIGSISARFTRAGWKAKLLDNVLALTSSRTALHPGIIRINAAGPASLAVDSTSGCFK